MFNNSIITASTPQGACVGWYGVGSDLCHIVNVTGSDVLINAELLKRVYVHFLVDKLPGDGIDEAIDALNSISECHALRQLRLPAPPRKMAQITIRGRMQHTVSPIPVE